MWLFSRGYPLAGRLRSVLAFLPRGRCRLAARAPVRDALLARRALAALLDAGAAAPAQLAAAAVHPVLPAVPGVAGRDLLGVLAVRPHQPPGQVDQRAQVAGCGDGRLW